MTPLSRFRPRAYLAHLGEIVLEFILRLSENCAHRQTAGGAPLRGLPAIGLPQGEEGT